MLEQAQEVKESTNNHDHQTQPEEANEQGEHVLQMVDSKATEDQAMKYSLTEQQVSETAAALKIEKLKLHNLQL